ncbi:protein NDRG1 [Platysternon megacephalum]|uniref:Protein NDRG1 n=1 Tax=Platysternon megacephalum TaxID=55544 RepID=A0A4D9EID8_9SAUR|nr:protein NDRG1 [Platysternon megacephalum]
MGQRLTSLTQTAKRLCRSYSRVTLMSARSGSNPKSQMLLGNLANGGGGALWDGGSRRSTSLGRFARPLKWTMGSDFTPCSPLLPSARRWDSLMPSGHRLGVKRSLLCTALACFGGNTRIKNNRTKQPGDKGFSSSAAGRPLASDSLHDNRPSPPPVQGLFLLESIINIGNKSGASCQGGLTFPRCRELEAGGFFWLLGGNAQTLAGSQMAKEERKERESART